MANLKDIGYGIGKYLVASDASAIPDIGTNRKNLDLLNFKVAVNNAYALYNFKDGMIDAYQTADGVDTATSTNESYDSTNKVYKAPTSETAATGGTVYTFGAYTVHSFTTSGSNDFVITSGGDVDALVIAGGGGGAGSAGLATQAWVEVAQEAVSYISGLALTSGTKNMTVGTGGAGGPAIGV